MRGFPSSVDGQQTSTDMQRRMAGQREAKQQPETKGIFRPQTSHLPPLLPRGLAGHGNFPCLHPNSTPPPFWNQFLYWPGTDSSQAATPVLFACFSDPVFDFQFIVHQSFPSCLSLLIYICIFKPQALPTNQ